MCRIEEVRENARAALLISRFATRTAVIILGLMMFLASSTALAGKSARGNPPTPANFRVNAITAYTIALAWDPAPANSGDFDYHLWGAYNVGPTVILPKTATSYTFTDSTRAIIIHLESTQKLPPGTLQHRSLFQMSEPFPIQHRPRRGPS
jgi:hypothetical protein